MTWIFDDDPGHEQVLELSFAQSGDSTTVVMINSAIPTDERRKDQDVGWRGCLAELERVLGR